MIDFLYSLFIILFSEFNLFCSCACNSDVIDSMFEDSLNFSKQMSSSSESDAISISSRCKNDFSRSSGASTDFGGGGAEGIETNFSRNGFSSSSSCSIKGSLYSLSRSWPTPRSVRSSCGIHGKTLTFKEFLGEEPREVSEEHTPALFEVNIELVENWELVTLKFVDAELVRLCSLFDKE